MKYLNSIYESFGGDGNEWTFRNVGIPREKFFSMWFDGKKEIKTEGDYTYYMYHNKHYDKDEDEYTWETKKILKVDNRYDDSTIYYEKDLISKPLYKIRESSMTMEQELKTRTYCGTKRNPKSFGTYLKFEKSLVHVMIGFSNRKRRYILPDGTFLHLQEDESTEKIDELLDFLNDTDNNDLVSHIGFSN